ncbi:protein of unknown function [Paenibacillus alvei]|uniref:Uncharacterized protein n=1 Tax=Paenibacillus alvei TaxID=44250 RepID=A0A383REL9_PAEAL|nr:protein of unknown function [Paenibacillus alvei]
MPPSNYLEKYDQKSVNLLNGNIYVFLYR